MYARGRTTPVVGIVMLPAASIVPLKAGSTFAWKPEASSESSSALVHWGSPPLVGAVPVAT